MGTLKDRLTNPVKDFILNTKDTATGRVRMKFYPRWMKICGVDNIKDIDMDNPVVSTEWLLCDIDVQRALIQGRRSEVLARMNEVQQ